MRPSTRFVPTSFRNVRSGSATFEYSLAGARRLAIWLLAMEILLVLAYVLLYIAMPEIAAASVGQLRWIDGLMDLDGEASLPAWFSSVQLFLVGAVALVLSSRGGPLKSGLTIMGAIFVYLSLDEGALVHDRVFYAAGQIPALQGREVFAWMIPYALCGLFVLWRLSGQLRLVWRNFRKPALYVACGAVAYVSGAVLIEIVRQSLVSQNAIAFEIVTEEFFEMAGVTIILYGLLLLGLDLAADASGQIPAHVHKRSA